MGWAHHKKAACLQEISTRAFMVVHLSSAIGRGLGISFRSRSWAERAMNSDGDDLKG